MTLKALQTWMQSYSCALRIPAFTKLILNNSDFLTMYSYDTYITYGNYFPFEAAYKKAATYQYSGIEAAPLVPKLFNIFVSFSEIVESSFGM